LWRKETKVQPKDLFIKKKLALFLGAVLLLSAAGFSQSQELKVRVVARRANVREKPSLKSDVVGEARRGMVLQVDGKEGEWYKVRLPLKLEGYALPGYIHQSLVEEVGKEVPLSKVEAQKEKPSVSGYKYGAGLGMGYASLFDTNYGNGLRLSGNFCYKLTEKLSLELMIQTFRVNVKADSQGLMEGKLSMFPIQLSLRGNFPLKANINPYLSAGLGYYLNNFSVIGITIPEIDEIVHDALGLHFGGGVDYFFHENMAVNADLRFCLVKAGAWETYLGEPTRKIGDINLGSFMLGIGIKYFF
jgi:outer membrane protein